MTSNRGSVLHGLPLYLAVCLIVAGAYVVGLSWWLGPLLVAFFVTAIPRPRASRTRKRTKGMGNCA